MLPSASKLESALLCPASSLLPRNRKEPGAAAKRGKLIHAVIAADLRGWERPPIGRYKIAYDMSALLNYLAIDQHEDGVYAELAMTWDPSTRSTTVHGENIGREYPECDGLHGTADIVVVRPHALVVDVKTGQPGTPAKDHWQLKHNAVALAGAYDVDKVTAALAYLNKDGSWTFDEVTWGLFALEAIADDLAKLAKHMKTSEALYEGGWDPPTRPSETTCRYCDCVCSARYGASEAA